MRERIIELLRARLPASLGQSFLDSLADSILSELREATHNADEFARLKEALEDDYVHLATTVKDETLTILTGHQIGGSPQQTFEFNF